MRDTPLPPEPPRPQLGDDLGGVVKQLVNYVQAQDDFNQRLRRRLDQLTVTLFIVALTTACAVAYLAGRL